MLYYAKYSNMILSVSWDFPQNDMENDMEKDSFGKHRVIEGFVKTPYRDYNLRKL